MFLCDKHHNSVNELITHIHIYHSINDITQFMCKYPNCYRIFGNLNSFKKHLNSGHKLNTHNNQNLNNSTSISTIQTEFSNNINLPILVTDKTLISETSVTSSISVNYLK